MFYNTFHIVARGGLFNRRQPLNRGKVLLLGNGRSSVAVAFVRFIVQARCNGLPMAVYDGRFTLAFCGFVKIMRSVFGRLGEYI